MNTRVAPKSVKVWTKAGWVSQEVDSAKAVQLTSHRARVPVQFDADFEGQNSEMDLIQEVQNEVMYGSPGLKIDELPNFMRMLMEHPDVWHITNTKLFRGQDPITQVYETGNWGTDRDDADFDPLTETVSTSRLYLEQAGILPPDACATAVTDILGAVTDGAEVPDSPYYERADVDVESVAVCQGGFYTEGDEVDEDTSDDVVCRQHEGSMTCMPAIPENAIGRIRTIREEYEKLISGARAETERELITLRYEQALDEVVSPYLTYNLNSPFCAHRYSPPRKKYTFIQTPKYSDTSMAAEERVKFFHRMFGEAAACESMDDLFGKLVLDNRHTIDGALNPNFNKYHRPGGFVGQIRSMYHHDKELANEWSINDKKDKDGNILQRSAFNLAREEFIREWREKQKGDEESLRIALWVWFDREATSVAAVYDAQTGQLVSQAKHYKDSIWRQRRAKAFQDLFLTRKQWDTIYSMVEVVKRKLKIDSDSNPNERNKIIAQLAEYFPQVKNLTDLASYERWATKRTIRNGVVLPSKIDRISMMDETKWKKSCIKKRRHLIGRQVLYNQLRAQIKGYRPTNLAEQAIPCPDPKCNCMAIGKPTWYEIQDGKGLLGIPCDGCQKVIWLLDHKEMPVLKTHEEAIKCHT